MLDHTDIKITYSESDTKGRYGATLASESALSAGALRAGVPGAASEAELTISKVSAALIIADHTFVPDELRGRGLAQALVERLVRDARQNGQRIVPLCPFVRGYAEKNREALSDVIQW